MLIFPKAPPPRSSDAGAHLRVLSSLSRTGERERSADWRAFNMLTVRRVSCGPCDRAASPTGAPPRCFACTGPFFRTGLECSRTHDPGGIFAPPFRPVRKAAPLGALAAALAGRRRTSRHASQRWVCETPKIVLVTAPGSAARRLMKRPQRAGMRALCCGPGNRARKSFAQDLCKLCKAKYLRGHSGRAAAGREVRNPYARSVFMDSWLASGACARTARSADPSARAPE